MNYSLANDCFEVFWNHINTLLVTKEANEIELQLHLTKQNTYKFILYDYVRKKNNSFIWRTADSPPEADTSVTHCQRERKGWLDILTPTDVEFQYVSPELCTSTCGPPSILHTRPRDFDSELYEPSRTVERALINWHTHLSSGTHRSYGIPKRSQPDFLESLASHVTNHGEQLEFARDTSLARSCSTSVHEQQSSVYRNGFEKESKQ